MRTEMEKNMHTKWNIHEAVCAAPVRPIIFRPSLIRSSFSFTSALITFDIGYSTMITTRMANISPIC